MHAGGAHLGGIIGGLFVHKKALGARNAWSIGPGLCGLPSMLTRRAPRCLSLRNVSQLAPDQEAVRVVRQRAALEGDDVLALHGFELSEVARGFNLARVLPIRPPR